MDGTAMMLILEIEPAPGREAELLAFLAEAFPFYEDQGSRMSLWRDVADPDRWLEIALYATHEEYEKVERLVRGDETTRQVLERWRSLLAAPPRVRALRRIAIAPATGKGPLA